MHPLSAFGLHAAGYSILDEHYISYISLSQNGQHLLTLTSVDLLAAGYTIATLSPCLIKLAYRDWQTFITCDKPRQSNSTPAKYFQP